jgi:hypothetical protein
VTHYTQAWKLTALELPSCNAFNATRSRSTFTTTATTFTGTRSLLHVHCYTLIAAPSLLHAHCYAFWMPLRANRELKYKNILDWIGKYLG